MTHALYAANVQLIHLENQKLRKQDFENIVFYFPNVYGGPDPYEIVDSFSKCLLKKISKNIKDCCFICSGDTF